MMDGYDYTSIIQRYEREKLVESLKSAVRLIIYTLLLNPEGQVLQNGSWGVDRLCISLEQILSHGYVGVHFWGQVAQRRSEGLVEEVENQCTSDTAKGRAWIRLSLNRRSLGLFFSSLLGADCLEKFYKASALLRSPDHVTALTPLLLALDGIYFNLNIRELREFLEIPLDVLEERYTSEHLPSPLPPTPNTSSATKLPSLQNLQASSHTPTFTPILPSSPFPIPDSGDLTTFHEWLANDEDTNSNISLLTSPLPSQIEPPTNKTFPLILSSPLPPQIEPPNNKTFPLILPAPTISPPPSALSKEELEEAEMRRILDDFVTLSVDSGGLSTPQSHPINVEDLTPPPSPPSFLLATFYPSPFSDTQSPSTSTNTTTTSATQSIVDELCRLSLPKITSKKKKKVVKKKAVVVKIGDPSSPSSHSFAPSANLQIRHDTK